MVIQVTKMKIAVLILSNKAPKSLPLHEIYWNGTADIFVHIDLKVPREDIPLLTDAHLIPRTTIYWGGWNMVIATMSLVEAAWNHDTYDRFVLISDDSTPLVPLASMLERLAEAREFIWVCRENQHEFMDRYSNFYFLDHPATCLSWVHMDARTLDSAFFAGVRDAEMLKMRRKKPVAFRHGDQWWALSRAAILRAITSYKQDRWLTDSFRFSMVPDEQYFQTVIGEIWEERFLYTDRRDPAGRPSPFISLPEIREQVSSDYLFARKIDGSVEEIAELMRTGVLAI